MLVRERIHTFLKAMKLKCKHSYPGFEPYSTDPFLVHVMLHSPLRKDNCMNDNIENINMIDVLIPFY